MLLAGSTGLVGGHILGLLLRDEGVRAVIALVRRPLEIEHAKLTSCVVDFERLAESAGPSKAEDVYCCLGTTIKAAGSRAAFRRVDFEYVVALAGLAASSGATRFLVVSSAGANPRSPLFYSRVKGEMEEAVSKLPIPAVHVFRPSFLAGERKESRPGERAAIVLAKTFSFALVGPLAKVRPIEARIVARAMLAAAGRGETGRSVYESAEIERMGKD